MADTSVGFGGKATILADRTKHFTAAGRTITSITSVTTSVGSTASPAPSIAPGAMGVIFRFDATSVTGPTAVTAVVTITVTLDNGDVDPWQKTIQVTNLN